MTRALNSNQYTTTEPQKMQLLDSGIAALHKRLEMIASAKRTIDIEYFIYNTDKAGRIFTQALIEKAQKDGIKVRLLVDSSFPIFQLTDDYALVIQSASKGLIEVRYYNRTSLINLIGMQFRSHRKSLIIDGAEADGQALIGGRNIADEYFDLSHSYNFLDTDIYIQGTLVRPMQESFDSFWHSSLTVIPAQSPSGDPVSLQAAKDFITPTGEDALLLDKITRSGLQILKTQTTSICHHSTFAADEIDRPAKSPVYEVAAEEVLKAQKSVSIESPYFVVSFYSWDFFKGLLNFGGSASGSKNVEFRLLTNSLHSTDAPYTSAAMYPFMALWRNLGIKLHLYRGNSPLDYYIPVAPPYHTRWGIHSKRAVIDGSTILVGTYNIDPRSKDFNTEMAVICRNNRALGKAMEDNFNARLKQSKEINRLGLPEKGHIFSGIDFFKGLQFSLFVIPANLFIFLL